MSQRNPKNPDSSTALQVLQILAQLDSSFIEPAQRLAQNEALYKQSDDILKGKLYNDARLTWFKLTRFANQDKTSAIFALNEDAFKMLILLCSLMAQGSNLVKVSRQDLCEILGFGDYTYRKAIKELKDCGCIVVFQKAKGHEPPVYMVNPDIATCGKAKRLDVTYNSLLADSAKREYKTLKDFTALSKLQIESETLTSEDGQIRMVSVLREKKEKEPAPTTNADS